MPLKAITNAAPAGREDAKLPKHFRNIDDLPDASLLALPSVAQLLGISSNTIWRWSRSGLLKPIRIGSTTRWQLGELRSIIRAGQGKDSQKIRPSLKLRPTPSSPVQFEEKFGGDK
jgi:predicted DNA-binding transcriptional regulator AlpA